MSRRATGPALHEPGSQRSGGGLDNMAGNPGRTRSPSACCAAMLLYTITGSRSTVIVLQALHGLPVGSGGGRGVNVRPAVEGGSRVPD